MKNFYIISLIILLFFKYSLAGEKDTSSTTIYIKGEIGRFIPLNNSNPSVVKSDDYVSGFSFGIIGCISKKMDLGFEFGSIYNSSVINSDYTLGGVQKINFDIFTVKILIKYNFFTNLNIQYNIGIAGITAKRPWFVIPSNISGNGKLIEEYPLDVSNNSFVTGLRLDYNILKWLSANAGIEYYGVTFNFKNIVHSEDKLVTKVYDSDFKLRAYYPSFGLLIKLNSK